MRRLFVLLFAVGFSAGMCGSAWGQEVTGSISGTVTDSKGGAVPGAKVTITNSDQQVVVRVLTTDEHGQYAAPLLPVGHYSVSVEIAGFKKIKQSGLVLNVSDKLAANFTLEVGAMSESVTVEANALPVDTQSATATGVISGVQLRELSLNSRNYAQLVLLVPGASDSGNADQIFPGATAPIGTNLITFQINGNRREENNWQVDGADTSTEVPTSRCSLSRALTRSASFVSSEACTTRSLAVPPGRRSMSSPAPARAISTAASTSSSAMMISMPTHFSITRITSSARLFATTISEALSAALSTFPRSTRGATKPSFSFQKKLAASSPTPIRLLPPSLTRA